VLLRQLLADEASRLWKINGVSRPNVSQLSVTTGLNRKDVSQRVRVSVDGALSSTEASAAVRVFTYWLQMAATESEGTAELTADAFVPSKNDKALLSFLADNGQIMCWPRWRTCSHASPCFLSVRFSRKACRRETARRFRIPCERTG